MIGRGGRDHFGALLIAGVLGCVAAVAAGWVVAQRFALGVGYPWKAAAVCVAMTVFALSCSEPHPFTTLGPANRVTLTRAVLVALLAALIGEPPSAAIAAFAVTLSVVVALLDGVDGWLARRSALASPFGARIDMETDALLILVLAALVWWHGKAGAWVFAGGAMRYVFAAAAWPLPWMGGPLTPTMRGKTTAVAQMIGSMLALAPFVPWPWSAAIVGTTLAVLTWSFAMDVGRLWRQRGSGSVLFK